MIIEKQWNKVGCFGIIEKAYRGWFLFGIIPLYIKVTRYR